MAKRALITPISLFLFGVLLLPVQLLGDFHFESAMLAGLIGAFWAAIVLAGNKNHDDWESTIGITASVYLLGMPLFIKALFTSCLSFDGFAFWIFTPLPSIFFGAALGRLLRLIHFPAPRFFAVLILLLVSIGILILEIYTFPQVYFYNHVWGIWPGPVYDEAIRFSASYIFYRWITFLWVLLFWFIPSIYRSRQNLALVVTAAIALLFSYFFLDEMRIVSPESAIVKELGGVAQTSHFKIFYDEQAFTDEEITYLAQKHEFFFQQINRELEIEWPRDNLIHSYLYAHAWQKKKLTGAKFTSYVPVWLNQGQLHIAKQQIEGVLKHEMVHVISRHFGNSLFNGSLSIGMIEGLAEAIAGDASNQSTLHQIVSAEKPLPDTRQVQKLFSIAGFYGKAGAISYTTSGSFVRFLLDNYPAEAFKNAYPNANFEEAYNKDFDELVEEWHQVLKAIPIDSVDRQVSEFIFAQLSLFQKKCPHKITKEMQLWDNYRLNMAKRDSIGAFRILDKLYELNPVNELILAEWMRSKLAQNEADDVLESKMPADTLLTLEILKADALFLSGNVSSARNHLNFLKPRIQSSKAANFRFSLIIREDSTQWAGLLKTRYLNNPQADEITQLNLPNQLLVLQKAIELNKKPLILLLGNILREKPYLDSFFGVYESLIDRLIFMEEFEQAEAWLKKLNKQPLRLRYAERVKQLEEWRYFSQSYHKDETKILQK